MTTEPIAIKSLRMDRKDLALLGLLVAVLVVALLLFFLGLLVTLCLLPRHDFANAAIADPRVSAYAMRRQKGWIRTTASGPTRPTSIAS